MKLHIGCGERYFDGWVNIDLGPYKVDLKHDVTKAFPYDKEVSMLYIQNILLNI